MKKLFCILFFVPLLAGAQLPNPFLRAVPGQAVIDTRLYVTRNLAIPKVVDTAHGLWGGQDSLGLVIQIRSTGAWYKRDTTSGGHKWTLIGGGSGGASVSSWDATLAVDSVTSRSYNYTQPYSNASGFIVTRITPYDYNPADSVGEFHTWIADYDDNYPDPRHDVVYSWASFNLYSGGNPIILGEAGFAFKAESFYHADNTTLQEFHLPEVVDNAGTAHRLMSYYMHREDGYTYAQSQIGSWSFRPKGDNTGASEWMSFGGGEGSGVSQLSLSSALGTGGVAGDQTNPVSIHLTDGSGNTTHIIALENTLRLQTGSDLFLTAYWHTRMGSYIMFDQGSIGSPNDVLMESPTDAVNQGYQFYTQGQNTLLFQMTKGINVSWQQLEVLNGIDNTGWSATAFLVISGTYAMNGYENKLYCNDGTYNVTLPTPVLSAYYTKEFYIKNRGTHTITLLPNAGETIDGAASKTIAAGVTVHVHSDNVNWNTL